MQFKLLRKESFGIPGINVSPKLRLCYDVIIIIIAYLSPIYSGLLSTRGVIHSLGRDTLRMSHRG